MPLILQRHPEARLVIIGEGEERSRLAAQIRALGLERAVTLAGAMPNDRMTAWYSAADVLILASSREGWANVLLEAMACGTPVAAFPVAGPLDVLGDSDGGVLDHDLRAAAMRALDVPRERARARALQFDWRPVCEQFIANLVPVRGDVEPVVTKSSPEIHKLVA
jgi:glycosyltransferase involved in cell wall biosynthesis